jgi:tRNA (guanine37-N1)-methyltransferase
MRILPPRVGAITTLDRSLFKQTINVPGIIVPKVDINRLLSTLSSQLLNMERMKNTQEAATPNDRILLFRPDLDPHASGPVRELLDAVGEDKLTRVDVHLDYSYWNADEILHAIIPERLEVQTAFEQVGHLAHMNLRDHLDPYKFIIGQVILDKNKSIKSVVNKVDSIDTVFRNFRMQVLAGIDDTIVQVSESGCKFRFDFSQVYWNSRLHHEHERLIQRFQPSDYVCDVFAGVGPFAVPAAKKGCRIYANDLNPESYRWMVENMRRNKIREGLIVPFNMDGREFVQTAFQDMWTQHTLDNVRPGTFQHVVMNLPATAIEFLDAFRNVLPAEAASVTLPTIHVHCFSKSEEPLVEITDRISEALGMVMDPSKVTLVKVRSVSPNKLMYCASFQLPSNIAFRRLKRSSE